MPKVANPCGNTKVGVYVYANDHAPPHFHIRAPGWEVLVDLKSLQVTRGTGNSVEIAEAISWAKKNIELLRNKWIECNEQER